MQTTVWQDKKLVGYLHSHKVEPNNKTTVEQYDSPWRRNKTIKAPPVSPEYSLFMNGVGRKDPDTADWTISLQTNHYYLRIFLGL